MSSRILFAGNRIKNVWGVEGGDLNHQRVQTHLAVGPRFFYFTIAAKAFGRFVRLRVYGKKPFVKVLWGPMGV